MTTPVDWEKFEADAAAARESLPPLDDYERPKRPRTVVRRRPSSRYDSPEELWAWHWVRMRVAAAWLIVGPLAAVSVTTAGIFFVELLPW